MSFMPGSSLYGMFARKSGIRGASAVKYVHSCHIRNPFKLTGQDKKAGCIIRTIFFQPHGVLGVTADSPPVHASTGKESLGMIVEFRRAVSGEDVAEVARLAREIWSEHYPRIIGQEQVDYMIEKFQSAKAIAEQIAAGFEYYFIVLDGTSAGYLAVVEEPESSSLLLSKIYVRKQSRGIGLGEAALRLAEDICGKHNLRSIRLTVNKYNARSIAWYEHMGFSNAGPSLRDIGGGFLMDDFVMEKPVGRKKKGTRAR
jgi:ribosomal protein S18 acetylase RimI-like enzyme